MEGERREFAAGRGEEERLTKKNFDLEKLHIPKEKNRYEQTEIPTVAMENQTLLGGISSTEDGFITEIFSQNSPFNSENLNLENTVINKPGEEGFHSSQDSHLCAMAVGETLLDQFKYPLTIESQNTILKVKIQPLVEDDHDNEILGKCQKLQDLNPSEEAKHTYPPYPLSHSYNVHFLSSLMMQQRNSNVLSLSTCPPEGTINQNVRMIPVIGELNGKNIEDVIAQGNGKLASMPVGGAVAVSAGPGSAAPAAAPAAAEEKKEEKKEASEESDDMGFGLFD